MPAHEMLYKNQIYQLTYKFLLPLIVFQIKKVIYYYKHIFYHIKC